uniref:Suppressor of forked domain-containing protein n=1 Tax=Brassica campestris TaxID=3711 RepID=M4FIX4_BRACM
MLGHLTSYNDFIEQYTELQEKYDELVKRHNVTLAGIVDVKKAAAKAAVKGRHGKSFAKAFSAELTAIRAEKEKEREFLKKENKGLKIQLRDTAEAVQAAGELLIRLREAEQYVQSSEERFSLLEEENAKLKMQMEKLKGKHQTEMSTMKQYLAESKLPGSALQPWFTGNEEHLSEDRTGLNRFRMVNGVHGLRTMFGINYALYEKIETEDVERTRDVYRQILGNAIGKAPKDKIFKKYIEIELQMGNIDRCRKLYERYLEWSPENCYAWSKYAELERSLAETERARAIFELAISQPALDMPELLWKAYIDFEIAEGELERTWASYERLLDRTKHYKVWVSFAKFEASAAEQEEDEKEEEEIDAIERKKECIRRTRGNFELHVVT